MNEENKKNKISCVNKKCSLYNEMYIYSCSGNIQIYPVCEQYIPEYQTKRNSIEISNIINARKAAKGITVKVSVKVKGKWIVNLGLLIVKFGVWITGANYEVIKNKEVNTNNLSEEDYLKQESERE